MAYMAGLVNADYSHASDTKEKANYLQGQLGVFQPTNTFDDSGYDTGFSGSFAYGRYLTPYLKLEGMVDLSANDKELQGSNTIAGNYSQDNYLSSTGLLVTLKGEYPVGPVDLFGGAGIGAYGVFLTSETNTERLGSFDKDEFDTVFGAHISLGANFNITERFYVGIEGRYRWTGDVKFNETVAGVPMEYKGDLNGYTVAFSAGFRF